MYKESKPMLATYELIAHLEAKGVLFELINKEEAERYLKANNNYFKLTLITKYQGEYPVWVFLEIIPFGRLTKFYKFIAQKYQDKDMLDEAYMLKNVRELRNACAHNNCIINDFKLEHNKIKTQINYGLIKDIAKKGITKKVRDHKLSNVRILQITTLLYLNKKIITSNGVYKHQSELLNNLKSRINKHIYYYDNNNLVQTSLNFLNKTIDIWYTNNI